MRLDRVWGNCLKYIKITRPKHRHILKSFIFYLISDLIRQSLVSSYTMRISTFALLLILFPRYILNRSYIIIIIIQVVFNQSVHPLSVHIYRNNPFMSHTSNKSILIYILLPPVDWTLELFLPMILSSYSSQTHPWYRNPHSKIQN